MLVLRVVSLVLGFALFSGAAEASNKIDLQRLLDRIDNELRNYEQSPEVLERVEGKLTEALALLRGNQGGGDLDACLNYLTPMIRNAGYGVVDSKNMAKDYCSSMQRSATSLKLVQYTLGLIRSAGYGVVDSISMAISMMRSFPEQRESCLRSSFDDYRRTGYGVVDSLNMAISYCR